MRFPLSTLAPVITLCFALASCVAPPVDAPRPAPEPAPVVRPQPAPPVASNDWTDWPTLTGDWRYTAEAGGSVARFGSTTAAPLVTIRCETATRRISLLRSDTAAGSAITIRTSFGAVQWPAQAHMGGLIAIRAASDTALDQIAFSRGRFLIESAGAPALVLPAWAEVTRVIEDCRG